MFLLAIRLVVSLAIVIGILMLLMQFAKRRYVGGAGQPVQVLHRQQLSRNASLSVVTIGSRTLVIGTTEQQVNLIAELDPDDLPELQAPAHHDDSSDSDGVVIDFASTLRDALGPKERAADPLTAQGSAPSLERTRGLPSGAGKHAAGGRLSGSVLSAATWRQAFLAVKRVSP